MSANRFRWSHYVGTSTRWLLGGKSGPAATAQTVLTKVLVLGLNVATGVITARELGPDGRGSQAAMLLWPQFLAFAMTLGLPSATLYNLRRHPEDRSSLFAALLILGMLLGCTATATGVLFIPLWLANYPPDIIHTAQWFMVAAPVSLLALTFTSALEALDAFHLSNLERFLQPLLTLCGLVGLLLTGTLTPFTSALAYLMPILPLFLWRLVYLWIRLRPRWVKLKTSFQRLVSYGVRSYGIDLAGTLAAQIDQVLVVGLLNPYHMGMYAVALSLSRVLNIFQAAIATVLFPRLAARPPAEVVAVTGQAVRVSTALSLLVAGSVVLVGPVVLHLLYGPEYAEAVAVFRILVVEVVLGGAVLVLAQTFMALGKPGAVTIWQTVGLGLSVPLLLLLIPAFGLVGAGLALLCSTGARLLLMLLSYPLVLKIPPPSLVLTRDDLRLLTRLLPHQP
ncbi:lipopolysaccharide biosynthesis protein [Anthocerotibacter panamensis]|uniref:lipopolysaccharide biosynthesis protein n=1 Tax=Anthocerotibacter panamensis TaxID=2857077 RepID=UPI001C40284A|nr:oligosaccharide flippase family protein [Anthocerotibacter panamensis]